MEVRRNNQVAEEIKACAPNGVAIKATAMGIGANTMKVWNSAIRVLSSKVKTYVSDLEKTNKVKGSTLEEMLNTAHYAVQFDKSEIYDALNWIKDFAGFTFSNGWNEVELLALRIMTTKRLKDDETGYFAESAIVLKGETTVRREIEYYLYQREMGIIGTTPEMYQMQKDRKKQWTKDVKKAKGEFFKRGTTEGYLDEEALRDIWKMFEDPKKPVDEIAKLTSGEYCRRVLPLMKEKTDRAADKADAKVCFAGLTSCVEIGKDKMSNVEVKEEA